MNEELESLREGLEAALARLVPEGRIAVISFHSIEDRIVKRCFRQHEGRREALAAGGWEWQGSLPRVKRLTAKPLSPSREEIVANPRARSAKLRVAQRLTGEGDVP